MPRAPVTLRQKERRRESARGRIDALNERATRLMARDYTGALALAAQVELLAQQAGHPAAGVRSLLIQSACHSELARNAEAIACAQRALRLSRSPGAEALAAECLHKIGLQFNLAGDYGRALQCFAKMESLCGARGDYSGQGAALCLAGLTRQYQGAAREAVAAFTAALALARRHRLPALEARASLNLGEHFFVAGDHAGAIARLRRSHEIFSELGEANWAATAQANLGPVYSAAGRPGDARDCLLAALRQFRASRGLRMQGIVLINLSEVENLDGKHAAASRLAARALKLARRNGDKRQEIYALEALGKADLAGGAALRGRRRLDDALALAESAGDREALQAVRLSLSRA